MEVTTPRQRRSNNGRENYTAVNETVKRGLTAGALAGVLTLCPSMGLAQNTSNKHLDTGAQKMLSSADTTFAMKAAQGGVAEVQLGQLAAQRASNPAVKAFGQQMVDDHSKANDKLKSIAASESVTLPSSLNGKDQAIYTKLQGLSGAEFDREYVKCMLKDHEEDIKEFQKEANKGKDPRMKEFAQQTLPTLQDHLSKVQSIHSSVAGSK